MHFYPAAAVRAQEVFEAGNAGTKSTHAGASA